jgi:hypothetical protein
VIKWGENFGNLEVFVLQEPTGDRAQSGAPPQVLPSAERSIFRAEARQHYLKNQEKVILPRLVAGRVFVTLWILALLFLMAGAIVVVWFVIGPPG